MEVPTAPLYLDRDEDGNLIAVDLFLEFNSGFELPYDAQGDDPAEDPEYNRARKARLPHSG